MGGQIRRGRIWRFWGAPIFSLEVPKYLFFRGLGASGRKIGAPQKRQIQPRRICPPICSPLINTTPLSCRLQISHRHFPQSFSSGKQICRSVPGLGGCQNFVYVFFFGSFLMGENIKKTKFPPKSRDNPVKNSFTCFFLYVFFFCSLNSAFPKTEMQGAALLLRGRAEAIQ